MRVEMNVPFRRTGTGYAFIVGQRLTSKGQPSLLPGNLGRKRYDDRTRQELVHLGDVQSWTTLTP